METNLALYVLTYNAPKQFGYWCAAFEAAYPDVFGGCAKYVINNSDDLRTQAAYQGLFEQYGFEVIPTYSNTGICGGRFLAAQHFDQSEAEYMVFFEDDMLMRRQNNKLCRSGFRTYHPQLFETCIQIVAQEKLSYLKLCFTEVFGDNGQNWASIAFVEPTERKAVFGFEDMNIMPLTELHCVRVMTGLPYATGHFHYCNWPILFTKEGNRRVFLENISRFKHESIWMKEVFYRLQKEELRAGCLLATPILHHRKYSYRPQDRIENEYGQKIRGVKICRETN